MDVFVTVLFLILQAKTLLQMNPKNFSNENTPFEKCKFDAFAFEKALLNNDVDPGKHVLMTLRHSLAPPTYHLMGDVII